MNAVTVYWDTQDPNNQGWAYRATGEPGDIASGPIDGVAADDIYGAIAEACHILGLDVTPDSFATDTHTDGGWAVWHEPDVT